MSLSSEKDKGNEGKQGSTAPSISLPKGGGAIRGIGEKFAANPVTGTGSLSIPIAVSPGRSGFGPQPSLTYDSGSGNGPFGLGWSLSLPSITRKTDRGLPKYQDRDESDTFILSGAEDLVPVLSQEGNLSGAVSERTIKGETYLIKRYRPRIEGLFALIERWTNIQTNETYWRSISRENITTIYGKTDESRIQDPSPFNGAPRVFSWLICETYDDRGNAIYYEYEKENSKQIILTSVHERNRSNESRSANLYLKRVKYGNKTPVDYESDLPREFREDLSHRSDWFFEVVFDYGEGHYEELPSSVDGRQFVNARIDKTQDWPSRQDPFSSFRAGFEVRTYRLCQRVLMFHHFPAELTVDDYLVRATEFTYKESPIASFITSVRQSGFKRQNDGSYLKKSLPALEFEYSEAVIQTKVQDVDEASLDNLPEGLDGAQYQWADIDGEGLSGILTEQSDSWLYKRNLSALPVPGKDGKPEVLARFGLAEHLSRVPSFTNLSVGRQQLLDLAGDGQLDVVEFDSPTPGFYERTNQKDWDLFRPFASLPKIRWRDPNLRFVDLTGDGHADILITEDDAYTWYPSLAETGFASGERVRQALDEEKGPRLVFADGTESIYLADLSGDGLTDLVRIRNGEVCYWPNLGYARFGSKVTMDNSPYFDAPDHFDQRRVRLADIDGSGVTDIIYLNDDGAVIYLNESGNRWADAWKLESFPRIDNLSSVLAVDLLGNGTACLVWSSPLPGHTRKPMRYIDLMGGQKPHLLVKTKNNLGAETLIHYAPSTKFYLADKEAGKPWITRIPFPVHVVERVETYDRISRNRFVSRYSYHHGYFDGVEREFRGFGMVEQWDTEEYAVLNASQEFPVLTNVDDSSHVPPVLTRTWFHTGIYLGRDHVSDFFAGLMDQADRGEYYREPGLDDPQARELLLKDTELPDDLTVEEEREACRALKGSMLRQEVYALDGSGTEDYPHGHPYIVTEQNFSIKRLQRKGDNRHGVFFPHTCEVISYHYERSPTDPRVLHKLTLEVDRFGNVLKETAIGYGRRENILVVDDQGEPQQIPNPGLNHLDPIDQTKQTQTLVTYTENSVTNTIETADNYRTPSICETRTYELTNYTKTGGAGRFQLSDFVHPDPNDPDKLKRIHIFDAEIASEDEPSSGKQRRLIEHIRTLYRSDDLESPLPIGELQSLALPFESYKLAFTPGLLTGVYGPRVTENMLGIEGRYVHSEGDANWWIPSGRMFYSPLTTDSSAEELQFAREHFFVPHRHRDPFHTDQFNTETVVTFDKHTLLMTGTRDALGNSVQAENDYRMLAPRGLTDPNGNRSAVAFDALGLVVGTAIMGKEEEPDGQAKGDSLDEFEPDLSEAELNAFYDASDPHVPAPDLLRGATTRIIYDLDRFHQAQREHPDSPELWLPAYAATLTRETHTSDLAPNQTSRIQINFSYSDGFEREIQKKIQAEPGPLVEGGPQVSSRWVGSGWTIFNNKGKPVRQYEPFFSQLPEKRHRFELGMEVGVTPVLFYDPLERVVATLHPNHTYEKVIFDPWRQETWDASDTVLQTNPGNDPHVGNFFQRLADAAYLPTWHEDRKNSQQGTHEQAAAMKAAAHSATPTVAYFDTLGRTFLTVIDNGPAGEYPTRVELDIEGNQREVIDAQDRIVMLYEYDMLGARVYQHSMDAAERWLLNNVAGKQIRLWNSRGHMIRTEQDELQRATRLFVQSGSDPEVLAERTVYIDSADSGLTLAEAQAANLRGSVYAQLDSGGIVINEAYDFKGNLLRNKRQLAKEYKQQVNWGSISGINSIHDLATELVPLLETESFTVNTTYDALNRPIKLLSPHNNVTLPNVIQPSYNDANFLERVDVWLRQAAVPEGLLDPVTADLHPVVNIDYNAKGQRTRIEYGNSTSIEYTYDEKTFRLIHLKTTRPTFPIAERVVQDLRYTYDPNGKITHVQDDADTQNVVFFRNQRIEPSNDYVYDAIYRLIEARGREHLGLISANLLPPVPSSHTDAPRTGLLHAGDGNAMGNYIESYEYDEVGNIKKVTHSAISGAWVRDYNYTEPSLIEASEKNNRLSSTVVNPNGNEPNVEVYAHDEHGNMTKMPHLTRMHWNFKDQLQATSQQVVNNGGTPEITYYVYNAAGQRVRKVTERQAAPGQTPTRMKERLYLGGFEIYREYNGNGAVVTLERETLQIMGDQRLTALVETRTHGNDGSPAQLIRYQFSNHLGSANLELDHQAQIISYEEYYPYGSTSYQAVRNGVETNPKRYRYTGKERDEETGLYYHGARYYACWLGRWTAADPAGMVDGTNLYAYVRGSPVGLRDPSGTQTLGGIDDEIAAEHADWENRKASGEKLGAKEYREHNRRINALRKEARAETLKGVASEAGMSASGTAYAGEEPPPNRMVVAVRNGNVVWRGTEDTFKQGMWAAEGQGKSTYGVEFYYEAPSSGSAGRSGSGDYSAGLGNNPAHVYEILWVNLNTGESGVYKVGLSREKDPLNKYGQSRRALRQIDAWNRALRAHGSPYRMILGQMWGEGWHRMTLNSPQAHWAERYQVTQHEQLHGRRPPGNQRPRSWQGRNIPARPK